MSLVEIRAAPKGIGAVVTAIATCRRRQSCHLLEWRRPQFVAKQ
jgi:hypothetical protein